MIKGNEKISQTAKLFYQLLKENSPELLEFASVESPTKDNPYIEPNSLVLTIPAKAGCPFEELYLVTRHEDDDILIVVPGFMWHTHVSWWSEEEIEKQMLYAINYIKDILNEEIIFVKQILFHTREESRFYDIRTENLRKEKRLLAVYSWNGTFDVEYEILEVKEKIIKWLFRILFILFVILICYGCIILLF